MQERAEKDQPVDARDMRGMNDVALDGEIVVDEIRRVSVVCVNATDLRADPRS